MLTPEAFFHQFQQQIVEKMIAISDRVQQYKGSTVLDEFILLQIAISENSPEFILMSLQDTVFSIIGDRDIIQVNSERKEKLEEIKIIF